MIINNKYSKLFTTIAVNIYMRFKIEIEHKKTKVRDTQVIYCEGMEHVFEHVKKDWKFIKFL